MGVYVRVKVKRASWWDVRFRGAKWTDYVWTCAGVHATGLHWEPETVRGFEPTFDLAMGALHAHVQSEHVQP